ncbi:transient-receptor-potential-like protein isoform X1 [Nasonia vitripennis]|uniref:Transient receptor ion channel domain-containing protein n=1 Tax=Nasonia vitripennis TaxID=7425 RepID=A0A7M7LQH2_NASVI|nr:transient-receptor-potential-like protein isoform X1 [Nasonia vitripennis]
MVSSASEKEMEAAPEKKRGLSHYAFHLPRPLNIEEKKYLLSVERGDLPNVRRILQAARKPINKSIDVNCVDSLGRGALTLAIEAENLEMLELLIVMGVETKDALLHAINQEFVEAVELLLEHEELLRNIEIEAAGGNCKAEIVHSWQKVDPSLARYAPDMTPLILAAQKNNYEILKLLLDRGATLPMPHDIKCSCDDCVRAATGDPLRLSSTRIAEYRALASPSLIALSSPDPLMTAFQLSWELRGLALAEPESCAEYLRLRKQVEKFAVDLLQQTRSSSELNTILNYDPDDHSAEPTKQLARLEQAIRYRQKKFVAHPHVQQLLAAIWYEGVPGFRRMGAIQRAWIIVKTALLFPFYCTIYFFTPNTSTGHTMRRPFMKFLVHASSYLFFLLVLILVSQRFEEELLSWFGTDYDRQQLEEGFSKQRGLGPSFLECIVVIYVLGFILEETREVYVDGLRAYLRDLWNFIDFTRNALYVATVILRVAAYIQQSAEINQDSAAATIPRERWPDFDPQLIAEGLFAAANIFSALKLVHLFSINPHLGPLQISLGRMVIDIVKFFFIYTLVLFAFACGLNQLLWYFAELERKKCYSDIDEPTWDSASDSCIRWRRFSSLFETCQSLFWASFGGVGIDSFELTGIKSYTRFWGLLMFGSYSVINVIVLLNLLIAMMSNSYAIIEEHADTEWKFARTKLWMSYFEEGNTLPPPFNILPHPKLLMRCCGVQRKSMSKRSSIRRRAREHKYGSVMKALIWRYVVNAHSEHEMEPVTEDDIHELKSDFSSWRCELLEILKRNGMDTGGADTSNSTVLGKKMRVWERRLMKDFQVASLADDPIEEMQHLENPPENEEIAAKWRRIARLAVLKSAEHRWTQVIDNTVTKSQIGRSNNRVSLRNQANLKRVMEEARRLSLTSPPPPLTPIKLPDTINPTNILRVLKDDDDFNHFPMDVSPAISMTMAMTQEPASLTDNVRTKNDSSALNYVNERYQGRSASPRPLAPIRTSPPRVVKRKPQAPPPGHALPRSPASNILSVDNLVVPGDGSSSNVVRPRPKSPRRVPEVAISPVTPEQKASNCGRGFVKIEPRSPRVAAANKSPRRNGGWL